MKDYRVSPGSKIKLKDIPTDGKDGLELDKEQAQAELDQLTRRMDQLQERLYAEHRRAVLFVLQAMDTGGKDGTIRKVFGNVNPQGFRVANFKQPSELELDHDYLWRVHQALPRRGEIGIFNRSHYEDVLVVRVKGLVPQEVWERRYDHINAFERMLADEGTTIVKFYLHISKEEQKARLEERIATPEKHWKFNPADLKERALWDEYCEAYEDVFNRTSTDWAPWHIVPADRKWVRNVLVARIAVAALEALDLRFPETKEDYRNLTVA